MARFSEEDRATIWDMREAGVPVKRIAKHLGRQNSSLRRFIADAGGCEPNGPSCEVARGVPQPLRPMNASSCVCGPTPAGTRRSSPNIPLARTMSA